MSGAGENNDLDEEQAITKQVESEVMEDLYKSSRERLQARRDMNKSIGEDQMKREPVNPDKYKSYLEELRRDFKTEKEDKIRNKSFEFDKSVRSTSDHAAVNNILASKQEERPHRDDKEKENVNIRQEIRNRSGSASMSNLNQNVEGKLEAPDLAKSFPKAGEGERKPFDYTVTSRVSRDAELPRAERVANYNYADRAIRPEVGGDRLGGAIGLERDRAYEKPEYESRYKPLDSATDVPARVQLHEKPRSYERDADRAYDKYDTSYRDKEFGQKSEQDPFARRQDNMPTGHIAITRHGGAEPTSSDKKRYNWRDGAPPVDPFEEKRADKELPGDKFLAGRNGVSRGEGDKYSGLINTMGAKSSEPERLHEKETIQAREKFDAVHTDRAGRERREFIQRLEEKLHKTERDKNRRPESRSPDLQAPSSAGKDKDYHALVGKCKRLEEENQVLLKNNSELRRENLDLKDKLIESGSSDLREKLRILTEKNKRLEMQLASQTSSPLAMPRTPELRGQRQFFGSNTQENKNPHHQEGLIHHAESFKHLPNTERVKAHFDPALDRRHGAKNKLADSVIGMVRQLIELPQNDDECKTAWKFLKTVVGEYVEMKKERQGGNMTSGPFLKKIVSTHSENLQNRSLERIRQRSEDHNNKWRSRIDN
jgi:hypothetical protein